MAENRKGAAVRSRDVKPALVHGREQTDGFETDCLSSRIGAGDDQRVKSTPQFHIDGDGRVTVQQGMTCPAKDNLVSRCSRTAAQCVGELCFGKNHIQPNQQIPVRLHICPVGSTLCGQLRKNPLHLQLLLCRQLPQLIVCLDSPHGLDKQGCAGGGDVMHQAGNRVFIFRLYRDHIALGAHGDNRLLQHFGIGRRGNNLLQGFSGTGCCRTHFTAEISQVGGGSVCNFVLSGDGGGDFLLQILVGAKGREEVINFCSAHTVIRHITSHQPCAPKKRCNIQQFTGVQGTAQISTGKRRPDILHAGEGGAAPHRHHGAGAGGLLQTEGNFCTLYRRHQCKALLLGRSTHCLFRKHFQHCRQFQRQ